MRTHQFKIGCVAIVLATFTSVLAAEPKSLNDLRKEKLETAQEWWNDLVQPGPPGITDETVYFPAARALRDAKLELANGKEQRIEALTEYRDHLQTVFDKIDALFQVQAKGGEPERRAEARYRLIDAKIQLIEEQQATNSTRR